MVRSLLVILAVSGVSVRGWAGPIVIHEVARHVSYEYDFPTYPAADRDIISATAMGPFQAYLESETGAQGEDYWLVTQVTQDSIVDDEQIRGLGLAGAYLELSGAVQGAVADIRAESVLSVRFSVTTSEPYQLRGHLDLMSLLPPDELTTVSLWEEGGDLLVFKDSIGVFRETVELETGRTYVLAAEIVADLRIDDPDLTDTAVFRWNEYGYVLEPVPEPGVVLGLVLVTLLARRRRVA